LLFPRDGETDVSEGLEIDEFGHAVAGGESRDTLLFVFPDAAQEIAGYADIKNAGGAGHDVDVAGFHGRGPRTRLYAMWH